MDSSKLPKIKIFDNTKCSAVSHKTTYIGDPQTTNYAFKTGKSSDLIAVDLDCYKWGEDHQFMKDFGSDFIQQFDTFTQSSPNGGYHLFFKYDSELKHGQSEKHSIDIRSNGGYIMGHGSLINGKSYEIVHNVEIKEIPQNLKDWLITYYQGNKAVKEYKQIGLNDSVYTYDIQPDELNEIISLMGSDTFTDYTEWLKFTTAMKQLDKFQIWDELSKLNGGDKYNYENNLKIWNGCNVAIPCFESILAKTEKLDILNYIKYKSVPKNTIKPTKIINRAKLGHVKKDDLFKSDYVKIKPIINYVLKSDTGTGKTTLIKNHLQKTQSKFISFVSRISLADEQYRTFTKDGIMCEHYQHPPYITEGSNLITTIDNIKKTRNLLENIGEYIIFVDEFNSLVEYILQADTCVSKIRGELIKEFIYILQNCKQFICVDADISDLVFHLIKYVDREFEFIENEYKHNKGIEANEVHSYDDLIELISKEDKYIVCCDSATIATDIYLELSKLDHQNIKLITGATTNVGSLDDHEKLIYSPKILYGLDSVMTRKVFIYMKEHTISPRNMLQQVSRCRNIDTLYFCFGKKLFEESRWDTFSECNHELSHLADCSDKIFSPVEPRGKELEELFNNMYIHYSYIQDCTNSNKFLHFIQLIKERGFEYNQIVKSTHTANQNEVSRNTKEYAEFMFNVDDAFKSNINKYLKLPKSEIKNFAPLFIDPNLLSDVYTLQKYFEYKPVINNSNKSIDELMKDDFIKELDTEHDFNIKKMQSNKMKYILIERFRNLTECDFTNGLIVCNKCISGKDEFIKMYKQVFNYRGKNEIKLESESDCSNLLFKMMKSTFNKICSKPKRQRSGGDLGYEYTINYDTESFKMMRQLGEYKREQAEKYEKNHRKCLIIDDDSF